MNLSEERLSQMEAPRTSSTGRRGEQRAVLARRGTEVFQLPCGNLAQARGRQGSLVVEKSGMGREFPPRDCIHGRHSFTVGHSLCRLEDPEGRGGKRLGDEFAADGFAQRMEGMPRWGLGNSRRPYRLNSDNKPSPVPRETTRRGLVSKTFLSVLPRR